jgi:hypothetical protein
MMGQNRTATTGLLAPGRCRAGLHVRNFEKMTARQKKVSFKLILLSKRIVITFKITDCYQFS